MLLNGLKQYNDDTNLKHIMVDFKRRVIEKKKEAQFANMSKLQKEEAHAHAHAHGGGHGHGHHHHHEEDEGHGHEEEKVANMRHAHSEEVVKPKILLGDIFAQELTEVKEQE